jgi:serralysin
MEERMEMRRGIRLAAVSAVALAALAPRSATAFGHLWEFGELYSNADGTVQFIELVSDVSGENGLSIMFIRSTNGGVDYHFSMNVVGDTMNKHVLIATAAFASQPGAVTPDYILPDGFLRSGGDTLSLWNEAQPGGGPYGSLPTLKWDTYTYAAGAIPTDGTNSLNRDHTTITTALNSPTNFAGQTGSVTPVPEPASGLLLGAGLAVVAAARRRGPTPRA